MPVTDVSASVRSLKMLWRVIVWVVCLSIAAMLLGALAHGFYDGLLGRPR